MNSYEHLNFLFWPENSLFDEPNSGWPMVQWHSCTKHWKGWDKYRTKAQ
jgi:hypothetical protein